MRPLIAHGPDPKPPLHLLIAAPRGFCAGVDRAIRIVELALERYGAPVYVRHEIVHNKFVVDSLKAKGAVFVAELDEVPDGVPVVFSAHGVPKAVPAKAAERGLDYLDATCPLVSKVHRQAERLVETGPPHPVRRPCRPSRGDRHLRPGARRRDDPDRDRRRTPRRSTPADPDRPRLPDPDHAVGRRHRRDRRGAARRAFPRSQAPRSEDICYATSNRQAAVKAIAPRCDAMLVIGAPNSSNSLRLVEVAERAGARARLVARGRRYRLRLAGGARTLGITAGASAPEVLVREVVDALRAALRRHRGSRPRASPSGWCSSCPPGSAA